jgi:hypothetical protein
MLRLSEVRLNPTTIGTFLFVGVDAKVALYTEVTKTNKGSMLIPVSV